MPPHAQVASSCLRSYQSALFVELFSPKHRLQYGVLTLFPKHCLQYGVLTSSFENYMLNPALEVTNKVTNSVCPPAQVVFTKVLLFIVFPPCQGGVSLPRSYQRVAINRVPPPAQVVFPALEVTKVSLLNVFHPLPKWCFPPAN